MELIDFLRARRLRLGLLLALLATIGAGLFAVARAQGQVCRDVGNLASCADKLIGPSAEGDFFLEGNVKIGPRGAPPVVLVTDIEEPNITPGFENFALATVHVHPSHPAFGGLLVTVHGALHLRNDPFVDPLVTSRLIQFLGNPGGSGIFFIDPLNQRIFNPSLEDMRKFRSTEKVRNENLGFGFLDRTGMRSFLTDGGTVDELKDVEIEFDLKNRQFKAKVPFKLKLTKGGENPDLKLTARITFSEKGEFSGTIDAFSLTLAGLTAQAKDVKIKPAADTQPAEFEAGLVEFLRADHPDLLPLESDRPELLFSFEKLRYKDGDFSIGGGSVALRDWSFGNAFRLTKQTIGMSFDQERVSYFFTVGSTLSFGGSGAAVSDPRGYPISLRIGREDVGGQRRTIMRANIDIKPDLSIGALKLQPQKLSFVYDPSKDFYGLSAETVKLAWNLSLGSQEGGALTGFRLGVNKNRDLILEVGGGKFTLPEIRTKALVGTLQGELSVLKNQAVISGTGTLNLALSGNTSVAPGVTLIMRGGEGVGGLCPVGQACNFPKPFEMKLSSFEIKVAGLKLGLTNPQGTDNGGFAAERVALKLPPGVGGIGGEVRWLSVSGNGDISVAGGGFELNPIKVGDLQFVGLKGFFTKSPQGGYEFKAAGTMPMPGMDPGARKLGVELILRERPDGRFGFGGVLDFTARAGQGVPIFNTGMELVQIKGSFDLQGGGPKKFNVFMRASSIYRVAGTPLVSATGDAELKLKPFAFTANARLSVLIVDVAKASVGIGAGQGFNGGPGFNASFTVDAVVVHGKVSLRMGDVRLSNGKKKFVVNGEALFKVGLRKNQFGKFLPPKSITLASVEFSGGTFRTRNGTEVAGVMGRVGCCFFFKRTVFYNFSTGKAGFVDTDDYKLIGAQQVREMARMGVAGYSSQALAPAEAQALGLSIAGDGPILLQETIPVQLDSPGGALFGISYPAGNPSLRLRLPDGSILSEQSVDNAGSTFIRNPKSEEDDFELAFILKDAQPGNYTLIVDNAPAVYDKVSYSVNNEPVLSAVSVSCGGPAVPGVSASCDGAPTGGQATVSWNATDNDSPDATVRVSAAPLDESGAVNELALRTLAADLPLGQGSYSWDLGQAPSGRYKLVVSVEDGQHAAVTTVAEKLIEVVDKRAPATPAFEDISLRGLPSGMRVFWTPNQEQDLAGYEIGFALERGGPFIYTRDIGQKDAAPAPGEGDGDKVEAQLWGLEDNEEVWVSLRAYDQSGNFSDWSEPMNARPWPVAPDAWLPLPDSLASTRTRVEVAFATPLMPDKYQGMLELRDSAGRPVPGQIERITNLAGDKVVGLRFIPAAPLNDGERYEVLLNGDRDGLSTIDGRMMPLDYTWSFTAEADLDPPAPGEPGEAIYLPLLVR